MSQSREPGRVGEESVHWGHSRRGATGSACKALTEHTSHSGVCSHLLGATDKKPAGDRIQEDQSGWTGGRYVLV